MAEDASAPLTLDATGLTCPLPVLRARKVLKTLPPGMLLEVSATDPATPRDLAAFCTATGHELVSSSESGGVYRMVIRRAG